MKRKRILLSTRAVVAFVLLLAISGYALAANGHFDNPVVALADTVAMNDLLANADSFDLPSLNSSDSSQSFTLTALDTSSDAALPLASDTAAASFTLPSLDALAADTSAGTAFTLPALDQGGAAAAQDTASLSAADDSADTIRWAEIGDVLFDLWFLAAVTAFVIVFQRVVGFVRARRPLRPALNLAS